MNFRQVLTTFFFTTVIWLGPANADPKPAPITLYTSPFKPYSFVTDGKPDGIFFDLVKEIESRIAQPLQVKIVPWKRALAKTQKPVAGEEGLIYPLIKTPERQPHFQWLCPIVEDAPVFFVADKSGTFKTQASLRKERIGVTHGSPLERDLKEDQFLAIDAVADAETNAVKLDRGRIKAWFVPRFVGLYTFRANKIDPQKFHVIPTNRRENIYIASSKTMPEKTAKKIQRACQDLVKEGVVQKTIHKYMGTDVASKD